MTASRCRHPRRYFTHMLCQDHELWCKWLDKYLFKVSPLEMDVRVGDGRPVGKDFPANIRKMAMDLSQKRIDAVAHFNEEIQIIEVTCYADIKAVGQLLVYKPLYLRTFRPKKKVTQRLVAEQIDPDIIPTLQEQDIKYELFPDTSDK